jgi:hypothetical protein
MMQCRPSMTSSVVSRTMLDEKPMRSIRLGNDIREEIPFAIDQRTNKNNNSGDARDDDKHSKYLHDEIVCHSIRVY